MLSGGRVVGTYCKRELPNYQVFDERRYFLSGRDAGLPPLVFEAEGLRFGVLVCEDAWFDEPAHAAVQAGAQVLCVLNASPFHLDKAGERAVLVDPMGTPVGFLDLAALSAVPVDQLPVVPATAVLVRPPSGWGVQADPGDDASLVVSALAGHVEGENVKEAVLVCDSLGQLIGTVSLADVEAALR